MWIWSALMPHAPVLLPEVGRGRENEAAKTLRGIESLVSCLNKPELLLILSPHQPYAPGALFLNTADHYRGSFAMFGAADVKFDVVSGDVKNFADYLRSSGIKIYERPFSDLTRDQGSLVPLYFLQKEWGALPPVIIASPIGLTPQEAFKMGQALLDFANEKKCALLASGDLSHRLTQDAPAGYEPDYAPKFENAVERALRESSPEAINALDEMTLECAGECGLRSVMAMLGLSGGKGIKIFSHEWPFGVGYCTAMFSGQPEPVLLARETVSRLLNNKPLPSDDDVPSILLKNRGACFVSIKTKSGELRGCIGTLAPTQASLNREIIANAVSASTMDPRFPPMTADELNNVVFSVDVLSDSEAVENISQLDPKKYGVIVSKGYRRGVLLPDLEGVGTAEQQVQIAAMKAGIRDLDGISLERFTVTRYKEL